MALFLKLRDLLIGLSNNIFVFIALLVLGVGAAIYLLLGEGAAGSLIEQILHRQQVITRAGAISISAFFQMSGRSLITLSKDVRIVSFNLDRQKIALDEFINRWEGTPIIETILIDREGIVKYVANKEGVGDTGYSVADREYFIWAKQAKSGEYFISPVIIARFGIAEAQALVPIATPLFDSSGEFAGVISAGVLLSSLTEGFVNPLKISTESEVYIIQSDGDVFYAPWEELVGENIFEQLEQYPFLGGSKIADLARNSLENPREGKLDMVYPKNFRQPFPLERRLVAYTPVKIPNNHWVLAVATPAEDALVFITPFYIRYAGALLIMGFAFLAFSIRLAKDVGYKEGFKSHTELHKEKDGHTIE